MTAREIAAGVRSGEWSAVEVLEEHLARIDEREGDTGRRPDARGHLQEAAPAGMLWVHERV